MKTTSHYLLPALFLFLCFANACAQSVPSCCSKSSTAQFAMLGNDASFDASHLDPLPFHFTPAKGNMILLQTSNGKSANAFEVKADKPTNNYLFVFHEYWGLNDYIKQEAEKLQYELTNVNVIALDLYDGKVATTADVAGKLMAGAKEDRIRTIINAAVAYVGDKAKIQTIGWCYGGGWSLQASIMAGKQGVGCVMYYGMPETDIEKIKSLNAPVLGLFAAKDKWITPEKAEQFKKDMQDNKKEITIRIFNADHAFANPSNPHYNTDLAAEAHELATAFLKAHL